MKNPNTIFAIINISIGLLFILLSIPLIANKIPMNKLYGFRIQKSFTSDENWYKINNYGGKQLLYWSILMVAVGVICFLFPAEEQETEMLNALQAVGPMIVCITVAIIKTIFYSKTL